MAVIIRVHLLARLLRIPLLRVVGAVELRDDDGPGGAAVTRRMVVEEAVGGTLPGERRVPAVYGRDLAAAEALLAQLPRHGRNRETS
ncbi:hypothetical protein ACFQ8E_15480 [Isoptericola sp. NPDC056573]|uniref:hypothetical protein n=1 Tax=unclassified Isoptericola TaxID=2623355 RepID=UPI003682D639